MEIEGGDLHPISNKILYPLLEAGSCEDIEDEPMQERWANLLASAALHANVEPRYIGILSELQGKQASIFEAVCRQNVKVYGTDIGVLIATPREISSANLSYVIREGRDSSRSDISHILSAVYNWALRPGCIICKLTAQSSKDNYVIDQSAMKFIEGRELDLDILVSLGVMRRQVISQIVDSSFVLNLDTLVVSELGANFYMSCNSSIVVE